MVVGPLGAWEIVVRVCPGLDEELYRYIRWKVAVYEHRTTLTLKSITL